MLHDTLRTHHSPEEEEVQQVLVLVAVGCPVLGEVVQAGSGLVCGVGGALQKRHLDDCVVDGGVGVGEVVLDDPVLGICGVGDADGRGGSIDGQVAVDAEGCCAAVESTEASRVGHRGGRWGGG